MTADKNKKHTPAMSEDVHNPEHQEGLRRKVAQDVEAFLNSGGHVKQVERGLRADPPRKPKSQYGSRPI